MISRILIIAIAFLGILFLGFPLLSFLNVPLSDEFIAWANIVRSFVETVAVVVAGYWTYNRFVDENFPYPKFTHRVESYRLDNGNLYLTVFITVTNQGKLRFSLGPGRVIVRQISPLSVRVKKEIERLLSKGDGIDIRTGNAPSLFVDNGQRLALDTLGTREWKPLPKGYQMITPGQSREIQFVFFVDADAEVIEIMSVFEANGSNWELVTIHSLTQEKTLV